MRTSRLIALAGLALFGLSSQASAATFTFDLNNSYASNENPGVVLTPLGGTLGATGYTFGPNQGLSLPGTDIGSVYNIEMTFSLSDLGGYRKIIDFKNRTSDNGLYVYLSTLAFFDYPPFGPAGTISPSTLVTVDLSRTASGNVIGYVNGVQQFTFADTLGDGLVPAGDSLLFFVDDLATGGTESSAGFVDRIQISDTPFGGVSTVPLPAALPLFATGLGALGLLGWRRKRKQVG
jgi:hypothetical protein